MNIVDTHPKDIICFNSKRRASTDAFGETSLSVAKRSKGPLTVALADESPARQYDSDVSIYDSFHTRETDECRDTSDTDSYDSDKVQVDEYSIASSECSDFFYSNDSSSGADDVVVAAVAHAIFDTSSSDMNELFLADTEESDGPTTDVELCRADYWTCVKCKNRQNNPMYRYCEKCYQIRKTLFPPRPKKRKGRTKLTKRSLQTVASSSDERDFSDGMEKVSRKKKHISRVRKHKADFIVKRDKSSTDDENDSDFVVKEGQSSTNFNIKNKFLSNVVKMEILKSAKANLADSTSSANKDSGFSSSSSQEGRELSSDLVSVNSFDSASSQETFCSEIDEINLRKKRGSLEEMKSLESTASSSLSSLSSNSSEVTSSSSHETLCSEIEEIDLMKNRILLEEIKSPDSTVSSSLKSLSSDCSLLTSISSQETLCSEIDDIELMKNRGLLEEIKSSDSTASSSLKSLSSNCSELTSISSQETLCSEIDEIDLTKNRGSLEENKSFDSTASSSLKGQSSNLSQASSISSTSSGYRSLSPCAEPDWLKVVKKLPDIVRQPCFDELQSRLRLAKSDPENGSRIRDILNEDSCLICCSQPKNGVFVHKRYLHLCCCYRCAVKIWKKTKKCPICNCKVNTVQKIFVH